MRLINLKENREMSKKLLAIAIAILLTISLAASVLLQNASGDFPVSGTTIPSYSYVNVGPNPIGVGQTATVNMFHAIPTLTSVGYEGMMIYITDPDGHETTLGPFTSDATGGTYTTFVPDQVGIWDVYMTYPGQNITQGPNWWWQDAGESEVQHLVVQEEPVTRSSFPAVPLPTNYWEFPVSAMNAENWYKLMGPWYGITGITFINTGGNFYGGNFNPYTESVKAGHVLWTKPWCIGGVAGGVQGPDQENGHFWSTRQYWPQYGPVIMDGMMWSDWYTTTRAASGFNGILCTDLYTGETLYKIDTTTENLRMGMQMSCKTPNMYGTVGPFIWTTGTHPGVTSTGTAYHMYDAMSGKYVLSIVNGTGMTVEVDDRGNLIGYFIRTSGGETTMNKYNFTWAIGQRQPWGFTPSQDAVIPFDNGIVWSTPMITECNGVTISPSLAINEVTNGAIVCTGGFTFGQGFGGTQNGWLVVGAIDTETGDQLWVKNFTYADSDTFLPYTRTEMGIIDGLWMNANMENFNVFAVDARTGATAWTSSLRGDDGAMPHYYDLFNLRWSPGPDGVSFYRGFGGDIWCIDSEDGSIRWYTNTTKLVGAPGTENPYGIWPLWVFECDGITNDVAYFPIGHEYNPPMFPGAQTLAVNITDGSLVWSELGMYIRSTAIAYGIMLSLNGYDNQVYAFGKGASATTVAAPNIGVSTETPITITGSVMDVSPGTQQHEVYMNFPNGLPCVSDESQSRWMEYVYQNQPMPTDTIGVEVTLSVEDANGNYYEIGTATTDTSGTYGFTWTPIIPGDYKVIATYAGSESYWGSCAETYFYANEASQPTPAPTPEPESVADVYFLPMSAVLLVAIIVVGIVLVLLLRKR
jgi:hypothetical protein